MSTLITPNPTLGCGIFDDIFMIWTDGRDSLDTFIDHLNNCHPTIKFTADISCDTANFLDTCVHFSDGHLWTDLYTKPTDTHSYMRFESSHPHHIKTNLPFSEFLRIRRNCSRDVDYNRHSLLFTEFFTRRGYPLDLVSEARERARDIPRSDLFKPNPKKVGKDQNDGTVKAISTFHPTDRFFREAIEKNWELLGSPGTRVVHQTEVIFSKRRPKNLKDHLVRAEVKLPEPTMMGLRQAPELRGQTPRVKRCPDIFKCRYCKLIDKSGKIVSKYSKRAFRTRERVCCKSNNLIYAIECTLCGMHYVGETKRTWAERLSAHFLAINKEDMSVPVGHHFSRANGHHGLQDVKLYVLEFLQTPPDDAHKCDREAVERKWQYRLHSNYPHGMNRDDFIPGESRVQPHTRK